ncbi:MAG: ATP-binding cassette domain-containing protein [Dermabacter sp.]|nr:ATP-binding cassette domain-containing protein [Dermabacter sp.]
MTQTASKAARTARRFSPEPLTLTSISITLGGKSIIKDLDLAIGKGEMVCLLGPSGCGKTTTLRMIGGFLTPDEGRITVGERDVTSLPPERRPSAMVFQNYALWPHMSVEKNVAFPLKVAKVPRDERTARQHNGGNETGEPHDGRTERHDGAREESRERSRIDRAQRTARERR